ncbi:MAG TPA: AsmA family protein [Terriglobales bacterium]|jgi:AsmA protein|nr:AsmA family protein [Terriglobales bacterium]
MKRVLKIVGIVVVVILLAVIALPFLINVNSFRPKLESELTTALGREVKVGNLSLSILSGSVSAEDLSIADDPAYSKDPFIRAKSLKVGVEVMPLIFSKTLHVTDITLDKPEISLLRDASGRWNFSSLGGKPGATNQPASAAAPSSAPPSPASGSTSSPSTANLSVNKLDVKDGRVSINRANSSIKPHVYTNVNISVRDFSLTSQFPFTVTADLPAGGSAKLEGKAGPINSSDASATPLEAQVHIKGLDLTASGLVDPSTGIAGIADFDGTLNSDGKMAKTSGTLEADKLKLAVKGTPATRPVEVKYSTDYDLVKQSGTLTQGDVTLGKAVAKLTGTYASQGESTVLNMKLNADNMPVDDLQAMLPALGVILPSGSKLQGGTLSVNVGIVGPVDKLVITGPIRLAQTKLAGFNLSSKMSAISALSGSQTGSDTSIQNLSADARVAPEGVRTQNINLTIPALGTVTGNGTISPAGALDYKMNAALSGGAVTGLTQLAGIGGKGGSIPFFIQGTTADPKFMPDVKGMVGSQLKGGLGGALGGLTGGKSPSGNSPADALGGLFGKKKKQ